MQDLYLKSILIFTKDFVCMCNHAHNTIRETCAVNIFIYLPFKSVIFITCEHDRGIMLENTKHNAKQMSFIISKLNWIISHTAPIFVHEKIFNLLYTSFTLFRWFSN